MERLTSHILLKRNLKALLEHRGKRQGDLARFVRRKGKSDRAADSWISHILDERSDRELPMEYWDRAAEFLGVDAYHFFQPGVAGNMSTERRRGADRRTNADRRLGQSLPERTRDLDLMNIIRVLSPAGVEEAIGKILKILDGEVRHRRAKPGSVDDPARTVESGATAPAQAREGKRARRK